MDSAAHSVLVSLDVLTQGRVTVGRISAYLTVLLSSQGSLEELKSQLSSLAGVDEKITSKELTLLHLICIGVCEHVSHNVIFHFLPPCSVQQCEKISALLDKCTDDDAKRRSLLQQKTRNGFNALHISIYKASSSS